MNAVKTLLALMLVLAFTTSIQADAKDDYDALIDDAVSRLDTAFNTRASYNGWWIDSSKMKWPDDTWYKNNLDGEDYGDYSYDMTIVDAIYNAGPGPGDVDSNYNYAQSKLAEAQGLYTQKSYPQALAYLQDAITGISALENSLDLMYEDLTTYDYYLAEAWTYDTVAEYNFDATVAYYNNIESRTASHKTELEGAQEGYEGLETELLAYFGKDDGMQLKTGKKGENWDGWKEAYDNMNYYYDQMKAVVEEAKDYRAPVTEEETVLWYLDCADTKLTALNSNSAYDDIVWADAHSDYIDALLDTYYCYWDVYQENKGYADYYYSQVFP